MIIASTQPANALNTGIVPPWLQGVEPASLNEVPRGVVTHGQHDHRGEWSSAPRGFNGVRDALRGVDVIAEQRRVDATVKAIEARYAKLGIRPEEGAGPIRAQFLPDFNNAMYTPTGVPEMGIPADSITVGVDARTGRSFGEAEDVLAHELGHRLVDKMTRQPLSTNPLSIDNAIHESLADTFAAIVDDEDPWTLGEALGAPIRSMDHPERLGHPGSVEDVPRVFGPRSPFMVPVGIDERTGKTVSIPDCHVVAGIPNKAASIIGKELGRDRLAQIYVDAIRNHLEPDKNISGLAVATIQSAKDLFGAQSREVQATLGAWLAVGVLKRTAA